MTQAKQGDTVRVHYTGKLEDGTVFDTSLSREPLEFIVGDGQLIPGFEHAIIGMRAGESKATNITADEAYGPHQEEMVLIVDQNQFPQHINVEIGQELQIRQDNGQTFTVMITDIAGSEVTLDANHPLAGKDLSFDIKLMEIV